MIRIFFGNIGCGKTTHACKLLKNNYDKNSYSFCFCNFPLSEEGNRFACSVDSEQLKTLGEWTFPEDSYIAIDEAGIEYNNRKYKSLPQYTIEWFKLSRHYKCDIDIYSQSFEDMDITLRRLATEYWYLKKFGPFTMQRRVYKFVSVDENTHQIVDGYRLEKPIWLILQPFRLLGLGLLFPQLKGYSFTFRPRYYEYFDSWAKKDLPTLKFEWHYQEKTKAQKEKKTKKRIK